MSGGGIGSNPSRIWYIAVIGHCRFESCPDNKNIVMINELQLIEKMERLIAEENHIAKLFYQFGRVPLEHREKVKAMRREVKALCASRRLAIIAERNQQKSLPQQQTLFS